MMTFAVTKKVMLFICKSTMEVEMDLKADPKIENNTIVLIKIRMTDSNNVDLTFKTLDSPNASITGNMILIIEEA